MYLRFSCLLHASGPNTLSVREVSLVGPLLGASGVPKSACELLLISYLPSFNLALYSYLLAVFKATSLSEANVHLVGIQDVNEHAYRRRAWSRGLAPAALKDYEHIAATRVLQLVNALGRQKGVVILGHWFNYFGYVMLHLLEMDI